MARIEAGENKNQ
ncbi:hypothetical protein LINPERHAP1_LOCUS39602 [Linum perenne]